MDIDNQEDSTPLGFADIFNTSALPDSPPADTPPANDPDKPADKPEDKPTDTPDSPPVDVEAINNDIASIRGRLDAAEREVLISRTENDLLKQQLSQRQPTSTSDPKSANEEFVKELNANPLGAITKIIDQALSGKLSEVKQETSRETEDKIALQQAFNYDRERTFKDYGELLSRNPEFAAEANRIYKASGDWRPDAMWNSAAAAYATLVRAGKMRGPATITNMPERPKKPISPGFGDPTDTNPDKPEPLAEFTPGERARIKKTCADLGIKMEDWVKQYQSRRSQDPTFGKVGS